MPLRGIGPGQRGVCPGPGGGSRPPVRPGLAGRRREAGGHPRRRSVRARGGAGAPRRRPAGARPPAGRGRRQLPVVLGEVDRLGEAGAGALLGALDPARNHRFGDGYAALPLDLAGVLFVAVAADPERIPPQLRERLELVALAGYTDAEKQRIAVVHLMPQRRGQHGLSAEEMSFSRAALRFLIRGYSHEPGVRLLDGGINALCRRAARLRAEGHRLPEEMRPEAMSAWLRAPRFRDKEVATRTRRPGAALGLSVTGEGGDVLLVGAACVPGRVALHVTGTAGRFRGWTASTEIAAGWLVGGGPPRRRAEPGRGNGRPGSCRPSFGLRSNTRLAQRGARSRGAPGLRRPSALPMNQVLSERHPPLTTPPPPAKLEASPIAPSYSGHPVPDC